MSNTFLKNACILLGALFIYSCINARTCKEKKEHFHYVKNKTGKNTLPIQLINGLPYIHITVNGKGPYLFGFDSGFGEAMELDADLAKELGVAATDKTVIGDGSGNTVTLDIGITDKVSIGEVTMRKVNTIIRNSPRKTQPGMENVKGIIGIGMFPAHLVTIDYPNLQFTAEEGSLQAANGKDIFDYTAVGGGIPEIEIKVGEKTVKAVIDSRSMSSEFKLPQQVAEKLTYLSEPRTIGKGRTVSSVIDIIEVKIKETIQLGQYTYTEPVITFPSLNETAIIGSKLLKHYLVRIDSRNNRIQLVKGQTQVDAAAMNSGSGPLAEYTGRYAGERVITTEGGFLYIKRAAGSVLKMLPVAKDEFTLEVASNAVLRFERDGSNKITALKVNKADGNWELAAREN